MHSNRSKGSASTSLTVRPGAESLKGAARYVPLVLDNAPVHPRHLEDMRALIRTALPVFLEEELNQFAGEVFRDDELLKAYFVGREVKANGRNWLITPYDASRRGSRLASRYEILAAGEQTLTQLAAFLYPCGMYYALSPAGQQIANGSGCTRRQMRDTTRLLLEGPMRRLRSRSPAIADTLSRSLGIRASGDVDADQVARIGTAVQLANLIVMRFWRTPA